MRNVKNIDFYSENVAVLEDYDTERWNNLAQRTNTCTFISVHGRNPINYTEVQAWVRSLSGQKEKPAAGTASSIISSVGKLNQLQA